MLIFVLGWLLCGSLGLNIGMLIDMITGSVNTIHKCSGYDTDKTLMAAASVILGGPISLGMMLLAAFNCR